MISSYFGENVCEVYQMDNYEKSGYLTGDFKMFHLIDTERKEINFHYHDFNKILLFIQGDVTYCIEGCSYQLMPYDIVFVQAGEVHRPIINSDMYDAKFMDLFSGSGGIGIEALSRGAAKAYFVENAPDAVNCINYNLEKTHLKQKTAIFVKIKKHIN